MQKKKQCFPKNPKGEIWPGALNSNFFSINIRSKGFAAFQSTTERRRESNLSSLAVTSLPWTALLLSLKVPCSRNSQSLTDRDSGSPYVGLSMRERRRSWRFEKQCVCVFLTFTKSSSFTMYPPSYPFPSLWYPGPTMCQEPFQVPGTEAEHWSGLSWWEAFLLESFSFFKICEKGPNIWHCSQNNWSQEILKSISRIS